MSIQVKVNLTPKAAFLANCKPGLYSVDIDTESLGISPSDRAMLSCMVATHSAGTVLCELEIDGARIARVNRAKILNVDKPSVEGILNRMRETFERAALELEDDKTKIDLETAHYHAMIPGLALDENWDFVRYLQDIRSPNYGRCDAACKAAYETFREAYKREKIARINAADAALEERSAMDSEGVWRLSEKGEALMLILERMKGEPYIGIADLDSVAPQTRAQHAECSERNARRAEALRAESQVKTAEWIDEKGSRRLKLAFVEGFYSDAIFESEWLAAEYPGWITYGDHIGNKDDPRNPPEKALVALIEGREKWPDVELHYWSSRNGSHGYFLLQEVQVPCNNSKTEIVLDIKNEDEDEDED